MSFFSDEKLNKIRNLADQEAKINALSGLGKNETCYILASGPSLKEYTPDELQKLLKGKLVIVLKQAFQYVPSVCDFLILNSWNFQRYDYSERYPLVVREEGPNDPPVFGGEDVLLKLANVNDITEQLARKKNFDDYVFSKQLERPWGPGVLYEIGFYLAVHLGVKKIVTLGWDVGVKSSPVMPHFYETRDSKRTRLLAKAKTIVDLKERNLFLHENDILYNKPRIIPEEVDVCAAVSGDWYHWLTKLGIALEVVSTQSMVSEEIPRTRLEDTI
nr:hypothetical protein [uncultured Cohaesibacter sp.]